MLMHVNIFPDKSLKFSLLLAPSPLAPCKSESKEILNLKLLPLKITLYYSYFAKFIN